MRRARLNAACAKQVLGHSPSKGDCAHCNRCAAGHEIRRWPCCPSAILVLQALPPLDRQPVGGVGQADLQVPRRVVVLAEVSTLEVPTSPAVGHHIEFSVEGLYVLRRWRTERLTSPYLPQYDLNAWGRCGLDLADN